MNIINMNSKKIFLVIVPRTIIVLFGLSLIVISIVGYLFGMQFGGGKTSGEYIASLLPIVLFGFIAVIFNNFYKKKSRYILGLLLLVGLVFIFIHLYVKS